MALLEVQWALVGAFSSRRGYCDPVCVFKIISLLLSVIWGGGMPVREAALIVQARGGGRVGGRAACAGWWARCGGEGGRTCRRGGRGLQEVQGPRWSRCLAQVTGGPVGRSGGWGAQWGPGVSVQTPLAYGISLRASPGTSRSDQWMWPLLHGGSRAQAAPTALACSPCPCPAHLQGDQGRSPRSTGMGRGHPSRSVGSPPSLSDFRSCPDLPHSAAARTP